MSYILDALNKSEQEKTDTKTPGLNTVHQRIDRPDSKGPQRWLYFFAIALTLNLIALGLWFAFRSTEPEIAKVNQPPPRTELPNVSQDSRSVASSLAANNPGPRSNQGAQFATAASTRTQTAVEPPPRRIDTTMAQPLDVRARLASIRFSSHIYAQDEALRMVVIDGQRMKEGDQLAGGIRLLSITEEGVVFTYQGNRFPIDVLSQWDN